VLDLTDVSLTVAKLDDGEKLISTLLMSGQDRDVWLVNQSGLYSLIMRSNKPNAKRFRKWVTGEVLPPASPLLLAAQWLMPVRQ
jgi:anti-repressor protein